MYVHLSRGMNDVSVLVFYITEGMESQKKKSKFLGVKVKVAIPQCKNITSRSPTLKVMEALLVFSPPVLSFWQEDDNTYIHKSNFCLCSN